MLLDKLLKCMLVLSTALLQPAHAFWWAPSAVTTTTESPPLALKQIPLTYFRTYTYQPLAGNPLAAFPFYHHTASAMPAPLLAGSARYDHTAYMHGAGYPMFMGQQQQQLPQLYQLPQQPLLQLRPLQNPMTTTSTTTRRPTTTRSTTTITTTTTTPAPPPPTTTTTASSTSSTTSPTDVRNLSTYGNSGGNPFPYPYPTFNRRAYLGYNSNYYRAAYPYPDYTALKSTPTTQLNSRSGQIQFAPCMCPMSVSASSVESNAALLLQGRTTGGEEDNDDLSTLERADDINLPVDGSAITRQKEKKKEEAEEEEEEKKKNDDAEKSKIAVVNPVGEIVSSESVLTQKLLKRETDSVQEQLSTNKIEEEAVRATREVEGRDSVKETNAAKV